MDIKEIDEFFNELVFDEYPLFSNSYEFEELLVNFQLENHSGFEGKIYNPKKKMSSFQTIELTREFIHTLPKKYIELYEKMLDECDVVISDDNTLSYFDIDNKLIKIYKTNTIQDVFSLTHEFMHYTNQRLEVYNGTSVYYTEAFSWFIELLLCDYIEEKYPNYKKDVACIKRNNFIITYHASIKAKIYYELIKNKAEGKKINSYLIREITGLLQTFGIDDDIIVYAFDELFDEIEDDYYNGTEISLTTYVNYSIAQPLAVYMYHQAKEKGIEEILDLNFQLENYNESDVLKYLNLKDEYDLSLSSDNLLRLTKEYVLEKKKVW